MSERRNGLYMILIGCLLLGLLTGRPFFFSLAYLFGALLFGALLWSWLALSRIQIGRQTQARRSQVGKLFDEQFSIKNNGFLPKIWIEVRDQSTLPGHHASRVSPLLLSRQRFTWKVATVCQVRGEFILGPLTLTSGDPFGLFQATRHIAATAPMQVYPATVPIYNFAAPSGLVAGGDAQRQRAHFVTTNAAGVRDYAPGDSFNRIHWRSSARKDKLLVKEFELDPQADMWIFLDLSAASRSALPQTSNIAYGNGETLYIPAATDEYEVVIAASIAQYFLTDDRTLGFITYSPNRYVMQPDRGNRQFMRILETLTVAQSTSTVDFAQMLALEAHHLGRGATAILISAS